MNRRPSSLDISKATPGFLQYKAAEALSPMTLVSYEHDLKLWLEHCGDKEVSKVTSTDLRAYLEYMKTDYKPRRVSGKEHPLAAKTLRNIWISLSAFFSWASGTYHWKSISHEKDSN